MQTRLYRHYKNKNYKLLGLVRHSETLEEMALYETLYPNDLGQTWVRPKDLFFGKIEINKNEFDRFARVEFHFVEMINPDPKYIQIAQSISRKCSLILDSIESERIFLQIAYDQNEAVAFKIGYIKKGAGHVMTSLMTAVLLDYQNLGLASVLAERQYQWCQQNNIIKIESSIDHKNTAMLRLNLKLGFLIDSVTDHKIVNLEKKIV